MDWLTWAGVALTRAGPPLAVVALGQVVVRMEGPLTHTIAAAAVAAPRCSSGLRHSRCQGQHEG